MADSYIWTFSIRSTVHQYMVEISLLWGSQNVCAPTRPPLQLLWFGPGSRSITSTDKSTLASLPLYPYFFLPSRLSFRLNPSLKCVGSALSLYPPLSKPNIRFVPRSLTSRPFWSSPFSPGRQTDIIPPSFQPCTSSVSLSWKVWLCLLLTESSCHRC